jgi:hypothetical protein
MAEPILHVTARTCPIDRETGKFQSVVAEATYEEAVRHGITDRVVIQQILQAHNAAEDKSKHEYESWKKEQEAKGIEDLAAEEPIMKFFGYSHLPEPLQDVSRPFLGVAKVIMSLPRNAERTTALRKLLESKDCAVRARL